MVQYDALHNILKFDVILTIFCEFNLPESTFTCARIYVEHEYLSSKSLNSII